MNDLPLSEYYMYCRTCRTYFDRWKYCSIEDTEHAKCRGVRTLNKDEFLTILCEDKKACLDEEFLSNVIQQRGQRLYELAQILYRNRGYRIRGG